MPVDGCQTSQLAAKRSSVDTHRRRAVGKGSPTMPLSAILARTHTAANHALMGLVRLYQLTLSPFVGGQCRFYPTCSNYALQALESHGVLRGSWLALKRLLKCHPFHPGGVDLPPKTGE